MSAVTLALASFPGPRWRGEKGLVPTVCACAKERWNSTGTVDVRLCLYTRDVEVDNVIRTVADYSKRVACVTTAVDLGLLHVCPQVAIELEQ